MTKLQTISHNHISLECRCGHGALVSVKQLLEKLQPYITVQQVVAKARCTKCGALGAQDFRLHYVCRTQEEYAATDNKRLVVSL